MEPQTDLIFKQKELYDRTLYEIRLKFTKLFTEMRKKDCTMQSKDGLKLLDNVYVIEGSFPLNFTLFMDTYLVSRLYLVMFTENECEIDYADFSAIYPEITTFLQESWVQSLRVLNPLTNQIYSVYDAYLTEDTEKQQILNIMKDNVSVYYESITDHRLARVPKQFAHIDDYFLWFFKRIYDMIHPKPPEPTPPMDMDFPNPIQLINKLSPEDKVKLFRGETIEVDFGFGKAYLRGFPTQPTQFHYTSTPEPPVDIRLLFIKELHTKLDTIILEFPPPSIITKYYINFLYLHLKKYDMFESEISKSIKKQLDWSELRFKQLVKHNIRLYFKNRNKKWGFSEPDPDADTYDP